MEDIKLIGWILVATGMTIRYIVARRRFYRRGIGGLQHFRSFERGVFVSILETVFTLFANLLLVIGVIVLFTIYVPKWIRGTEEANNANDKDLDYRKLVIEMLPLPHTSEQVTCERLILQPLAENHLIPREI